ncbi:hypothetical protein TeGR_g14484 [Tetraparma gracilis]|uniref:folate gamma-glutamyl hydrolase n=1 Tax=Tetraparma gracilis TaxID=2962635 RepID=A0ABQ6MIZ1_9STRA|nr:hypothetical protein TeGR_g14484 [Tetraparma gracilis]
MFRAAVLSALAVSPALSQQLFDQPVIGVLTFPDSSMLPPYTSFFDSSYVKWIEQSGARVAPIRFDMSSEDLAALFPQLNGILFTGGAGMPEDNDAYFSTASRLWELVQEDSETVPLWGTCLGFEMFATLWGKGEDNVLSDFDAENLALPLGFTADSKSSKLFSPSTVPEDVYETLGTQNVTTNWHTYGVSVDTFEKVLAPQGLVALTTNEDREGKVFVSSMEHESAPFYAVQWHPESNQFDTTDKHGDATPDRSVEGVAAMQYMSHFLVGEARKNAKTFESEDAFKAIVLGQLQDDVATDGCSTMVVTLSGDRAQVDEKTAAAFIQAVGVYLEELAMMMV